MGSLSLALARSAASSLSGEAVNLRKMRNKTSPISHFFRLHFRLHSFDFCLQTKLNSTFARKELFVPKSERVPQPPLYADCSPQATVGARGKAEDPPASEWRKLQLILAADTSRGGEKLVKALRTRQLHPPARGKTSQRAFPTPPPPTTTRSCCVLHKYSPWWRKEYTAPFPRTKLKLE